MSSNGFDKIFDEKIGYGRYQRIAYFIIGLTALSDESEIISLSVVLPRIRNEWNLDDSHEEQLGSVLFIGIFLGSVIVGLISDRIGRRSTLLFSSLIQSIIGICSSLSQNFMTFLIFRGTIGFMIGCTLPVAPTYVTEISPTYRRGKGQVYIQAFFVIGMVYAMSISKTFLQDLTSGNWRLMLVFAALPSMIVFIGTWKYLLESPRFLIVNGNISDGIANMTVIGIRNKGSKYFTIPPADQDTITQWQKNLFAQKEVVKWTKIFKKQHRKTTWLLIADWFGLSHNFFGMIFILPVIFEALQQSGDSKYNKGVDLLFLTMLGEIPALIIAYFVIDRKFFGRKNTSLFSHIIACITFGTAFLLRGTYLVPLMIVSRVFTKLPFITINPLTTESYPTTYRTMAIGITSGIGRIGSTIMPIIDMHLFDADPFLPFLGFSFVCLGMAVATYKIPFETAGIILDANNSLFQESDKLKLRELDEKAIEEN